MPIPKNRAPSVRKIKYRAPSGESRVRYRRRVKGNAHSCALTGEKLTGVTSVRGLSASKHRPNRPFGGRLSPSASRRVIIFRSRLASNAITIDDVPVELLPYMRKNAKK